MIGSQRDLMEEERNNIREQFVITPEEGALTQEITESRPLMVTDRKSLIKQLRDFSAYKNETIPSSMITRVKALGKDNSGIHKQIQKNFEF